jgi:hypothetical protein
MVIAQEPTQPIRTARAAGAGQSTEQLQVADDIQGRRVLTAYAHVR